MRDSEFHRKIDAFALRVEATIADTRSFLDSLPEFREGASERAKQLDKFLRRFGV